MQSFATILYVLGCLALCVSAATIPQEGTGEERITDLLYLDIAQRSTTNDNTDANGATDPYEDATPFGTIVIGLFGDVVPNTVANFKQLAPIYQSTHTIFHRIIPGFVIQAGDIDGKGGHSAFGEKGMDLEIGPFYSGLKDENFILKHNKPGRVSVANAGPNTGGSQFFITLAELPHLDGKHVVFGEVLKGLDTAVHEIASVQRDSADKPFLDVFISKAFATKYEKESQLELTAAEAHLEAPIEEDKEKVIVPTTPLDPLSEVEMPDKLPESETNTDTYASDHPTGLGGSRHHFVFIPFVLIIGMVGFLTYKNKRSVMAMVRGPRYRRITSVQSD